MTRASIASSIVSRTAAAVVGGYALANLLAIAAAGLMPTDRADAVLAAMLGSFAIHTAAVLWVFAARSAGRAWLGLLLPAILAGAAAWLVT